MSKGYRHRLARLLRIAVSWCVAFQGNVLPGAIGTLYAQNTDQLTIGVTPFDFVSPAAISDLLASANPVVQGQISLTWTAPQGNVGGTPMPNWPVAAYSVRYATFSVSDVGGSTTTWWNSTVASDISLQPPTYSPKAPGQLEAYTLAGLTPGAHYYFAVKSISQAGIFSPIDMLATIPNQQANAIATQLVSGTGTPLRPNGLSMTLSAGQFTLNWHPVLLDAALQPIAIGKYMVFRYDTIGSSPTVSVNIPANVTSYTDVVGGLTYFYRVVAVSASGVSSVFSDYVDSSNQINRYALAPADQDTRMTLPGTLAVELNAGLNGTTDDYEIVAVHQPQNENTTTLKSYLFQVQNARTGAVVPNFSFSQPVAEVQVSYALGTGPTIGFRQPLNALNPNTSPQAQAVAQLISLYWFNGSSFIRLGGTVLLQNQALSVTAKNLGLYEIRAVSVPTTFALTKGSPYPRVITPNGGENHRVFWFFDNPSAEEVTGTIYDIRGAKVRELAVSSQSPTANSIVWDGRDDHGAVVPSGVYLYKIQAGKEKSTGTVVVAR